MRNLSNVLARLALVLAVAAPAYGADHIKLKDGTVVNGKATAYDSQKKTLSFRTEQGQDKTYTLDQLDARSVYMVNASTVPKDNGRAQLQLANFARDIELYAHAGRRYGYAEQADPSLKPEIDKERAIGKKLAAEYCMRNAKESLSKNKVKDAEEWLTTLVQKLPDEPLAAEATQMLDQYYTKERNARDDELEAKHADLIQGDLQKGKKLYDGMIQKTKDGLTARNDNKAVALWKDAIKDGQGVLKEIDRISAKYKDDPRIQEGADRYRALTIEQMIDAHLNIASSLTVSSSYKEALKETNAALALDPQNMAALSQRARIEQAASEGLGLDIF